MPAGIPFAIQRYPLGIGPLLNISSGASPAYINQEVQGSLELLQLYGLTQLTTGFANNAAAAEGAAVPLVLSADRWTVLFAAQASIVKTATATALWGDVTINRRTQFGVLLFGGNLGPFGATESGTVSVGGYLQYPLVCPPGTTISATARVIGTDATANVSVFAEFGTL